MAEPPSFEGRDPPHHPIAKFGAVPFNASSCLRRLTKRARRSKSSLEIATMRVIAMVLGAGLITFDAMTLSASESKDQQSRKGLFRLALKGVERQPGSRDLA